MNRRRIQSIVSFANFIGRLLRAGDFLVRAIVANILAFPFFIAVAAYFCGREGTALLTLELVILLITWLFTAVGPSVKAIVALSEEGHKLVKGVSMVIAIEICLGVYFSIVPTYAHPSLVPLFILVLFGITFFSIGGVQNKAEKIGRSSLVVIAVVITIMFITSSILPKSTSSTTWDKIWNRIDNSFNSSLLDTSKVNEAGLIGAGAYMPQWKESVVIDTGTNVIKLGPVWTKCSITEEVKHINAFPSDKYQLFFFDPDTEATYGPGDAWKGLGHRSRNFMVRSANGLPQYLRLEAQ